MRLKFWHGAVAGIAIALFFIIDGCNSRRQVKEHINAINNYQDTVITERTKSGRLLSYNKNLKVTEETLYLAVDSLHRYIKDLGVRNPEVVTIVKSELRVDTVEIPVFLTDCEFDTTFVVDSTNYKIDGRITNRGLTFNSISFPNEMGLVVGYKKDKWCYSARARSSRDWSSDCNRG